MKTPELLSDPVYHDEEEARLYLQEVRWPDGVYCPYCGTLDDIKPLGGDSMGPGWFYCAACQDKFTVRVGSIFERSHIPLHKWLLAFRLMASSKKGVSAHQLHRTFGITYKSAWFLAHRIREAMKPSEPPTLGGEGKVIEADETFYGFAGSHEPDNWVFVNEEGWVRKTRDEKMKVMTLVERGGGAHSIHLDRLTSEEAYAALTAFADQKSELHTDEAHMYERIGKRFAAHEAVNHADSLVQGSDGVSRPCRWRDRARITASRCSWSCHSAEPIKQDLGNVQASVVEKAASDQAAGRKVDESRGYVYASLSSDLWEHPTAMADKVGEATETVNLQFHYIKGPEYREAACHGAIGGRTPQGKIWMGFFSERMPIPRIVQYEIPAPPKDAATFDFRENGETPSYVETRQGVIRHVDYGIYLDVDVAERLRDWLNRQIEQLRNPA